jgi:hypothetical protein
MSPFRKPRQDRPLVEQHEEWMAHLRRQAVSRRTVMRGAIGAAAGGLLLGRPARAQDHDGAAVHQRAGPRAGPGGVLPHRRRLKSIASRKVGQTGYLFVRPEMTERPAQEQSFE